MSTKQPWNGMQNRQASRKSCVCGHDQLVHRTGDNTFKRTGPCNAYTCKTKGKCKGFQEQIDYEA